MSSKLESYKAQMRRKCNEANARVCKNAKELKKAIEDFTNASKGEAKADFCAAILDGFSRLIQRTPVDTGRARAGWHVEPHMSEWKPSKSEVQNDVAKILNDNTQKLQSFVLTDADVIYIMNNVEYILQLEAGHSPQSSGFFALFIEELKMQLENVVRELNAQ